MILKAKNSDIDELVKLHQMAFPGFFLTSLGGRFLKLLYLGFIEETKGICLAMLDEGRLVGLAAGTTDPENFFRHLLKKKGLLLGAAAIPGLIGNPIMTLRKCSGALFYRGDAPEGIPNAALLSSLAVSPHAGRKGLGRLLVKGFSEESKIRGSDYLYLMTDRDKNEAVNRFYEKCGFDCLDTFKRPGNRQMNRWVLRL